MMRRSAIVLLAAMVLAGLVGCEAKTRYRALCVLFDGVPPPQGMEPCDSDGIPTGYGARGLKTARNEERQYSQHGPYAARMCEGCHKRQSNELLMAKEELCFNCHDLAIKKRIVHGPVAAGSCVVCHDPHGSGNKYLLVAKSQEFCLHCHKKEDLQKNGAHLDMEEGCTTCHNAHASDNDYLLISKAADVYKAKRQSPPRASRPRKEQALREGQPTTSSTKQGFPSTSSTKQGQPTTSSTKQTPPSTSSTKQGLPPTSSTKQAPPSTSSTKQGLPPTSYGLGPEKSGKKLPTTSGTLPLPPGADLTQKRTSRNTPVILDTERKFELSEASLDR